MKKIIENILFGSKWLLIPFYGGLIAALGIYAWVDLKELWHMVLEIDTANETSAMLTILVLVDMAMIAGLVKMIITGSYTSYISKTHSEETEKTSSGLLKVKMSTAIIGVSSIHMLKTFIGADDVSMELIYKQLWLHGSFLVGSIVLAIVEYLHAKAETFEKKEH